MIKKLICCLTFCALFEGSIYAGIPYSPADSIVSRDSLNKKPGTFRTTNPEVEIIFDESKLAPQNVRSIFNELFRQYITVKDALVYNDSFGAVRNTLKLLDDMKSKTKDIDILKKDDKWILFIKNYDNIRSKVESTTFISDQRFLFNEITNGLKTFIKQYGLYDKTIYLMQCKTDSQNTNGEWFADSRDKKNPYLGLLKDTSCAKIKEVWKFK
jgi:hypothetical protein